jgi:hypothetical protein
MDEDLDSVPTFSPMEWSLLCPEVGFGTKGQEENTGLCCILRVYVRVPYAVLNIIHITIKKNKRLICP